MSPELYKLRHEEIDLGKQVEEFAPPEVKDIVMKHFSEIVEKMSDEMEELLYL